MAAMLKCASFGKKSVSLPLTSAAARQRERSSLACLQPAACFSLCLSLRLLAPWQSTRSEPALTDVPDCVLPDPDLLLILLRCCSPAPA